MPDHSHDNISSTNANLAHASEGQVWDSLNPDQKAQLLGQSIASEASNSINKNSVYQEDEGRAYETMPYTSLPPHVQFEVSNRLHEAGYFQDSYGGKVYEVEGDDRFECKDCEETFTAEEDFRVHRKINHDDNGESETESQEAYFKSLEIDPDVTKDNLEWAKKLISGESSRVEYPQNDPSTASDPPLPKGRKEYDDNPNHYFYDNKLFKRGSRGGNYEQTGTALTEARALIELEEKILNKYGWESTKDIEKSPESRDVFARAIANEVNVNNLHPRTIKILDSVHRPFLVNTLSKIAQETDAEDRGDKAPFIEEEPVLHQDYDPEHPHEHNTFDTNFGDKVAEEDHEEDETKVWKKTEENQEDVTRTCPTCGFYSADEEELHSHVQDHSDKAEEDIPTKEDRQMEEDWRKKHGEEDFPFEDQEEQTTVTAEPDLLQNVNTDVLQVEAETDYDPEEKVDQKAEEARILQQYTGYKPKAGEALGDIMDGAINVPLERLASPPSIFISEISDSLQSANFLPNKVFAVTSL